MSDDAGGKSALNDDGFGVTGQNRTDALRQLLEEAEAIEFEKWHGGRYRGAQLLIAQAAWKARASLSPRCRGVAHPGCEYLAACGTVCNKCGQIL